VEIQVAAYHVRVKERGSAKTQMLDAIGGSDDLLEFLSKGLSKWKTDHHNDKQDGRVSKLQKLQVIDRVLQGRVQVGDYGQACDVIDATTTSVVFTKGTNHADLLPFFFRIEIPRHRDEALFLIEKSRRTSPKTAFTKLIKEQFVAQFPGFALAVNPVMPDEVFRRYMDSGGVQKIEFVKMGLPHDVADILEGGHAEELKRATTKLVISAPRKGILPLKKKILSSNDPRKTIGDLYELSDFTYENVAITMRLGKNSRKVDLGKKRALPLYNITSEVKTGADGSPSYDSMASAFESLATDINEGAYATS
jgi:hypothetical protein